MGKLWILHFRTSLLVPPLFSCSKYDVRPIAISGTREALQFTSLYSVVVGSKGVMRLPQAFRALPRYPVPMHQFPPYLFSRSKVTRDRAVPRISSQIRWKSCMRMVPHSVSSEASAHQPSQTLMRARRVLKGQPSFGGTRWSMSVFAGRGHFCCRAGAEAGADPPCLLCRSSCPCSLSTSKSFPFAGLQSLARHMLDMMCPQKGTAP